MILFWFPFLGVGIKIGLWMWWTLCRGGATWWFGGAMAPAKIFFFPLDYEEKKNWPPQHSTAGPPTHFSPILPALNQKLETPSN